MAEEKAADLKQLFVYEHDAGRLELFIRIVYGWIAIGIGGLWFRCRDMPVNPVVCDIDTGTQKRRVEQLHYCGASLFPMALSFSSPFGRLDTSICLLVYLLALLT